MLDKLRSRKTAKKIWIILAVLILPAFVLWGSGSLIRNKQSDDYAGRLFGRKISTLEYKDALAAVKNLALIQFGDKLSEVKQYLRLENQAWERLILLHEAKKRGIRVADNEVIEAIRSYPFFQNNGAFDSRIYNETLQYYFRTPPRVFEEQTRNNLVIAKLYKLISDGVTVSEEEIKEEYARQNEEFSIWYICALIADFTDTKTKPGQERLRAYFSENSVLFKQPLSFNISYIGTESETLIKEAAEQLKKRKEITAVGKGLNLEVKETGFFALTEPIPGIGWTPEIMQLLTRLKPGQISPSFKVDNVYYILQMKEQRQSFIPEFETVQDKVREYYLKAQAERLAQEKIEQCRQALEKTAETPSATIDFANTAKGCGLKTDVTPAFKYGSYIEKIGASDTFWLAAQRLKNREFSGIIKTPEGFFIIRVKDKIAADAEKFEKEKAVFTGQLLARKKQEFFTRFLTGIGRAAE